MQSFLVFLTDIHGFVGSLKDIMQILIVILNEACKAIGVLSSKVGALLKAEIFIEVSALG